VQFSQQSWINQSENRYSTLLKTTTKYEQNLIANSRKYTAKIYRDFFDKINEIWNGEPAKQRAKVVLKILDLNTWRLRSVWTLKREILYLPWSDEFQRYALLYLLNSNASIRNLFIQLNQRLNNCKLTSKSKGIVQWNFIQCEYFCKIMCKNFCSEFPVQDCLILHGCWPIKLRVSL
jgi:hypothetical protein